MESAPIYTIHPPHRNDIINLWLFHKETKESNGNFLKDKCRIVTLSQVRDTSTIGQTCSPTVNPISLFISLGKSSDSSRILYLRLWCERRVLELAGTKRHIRVCESGRRAFSTYRRKKQRFKEVLKLQWDTLTFRLRRYLYGRQESPLAGNEILQKLEAMTFQRSTADQCVYVKCH